MQTSVNEADVFNGDALSPRDQVSEWVNIKKNVGDKVSGIFMGWWESPAQNGFKAQLGIALRQNDGKVVGVNVTDTSYMRQRISPSQIGDRVGLKFEGEKDTGQIQKAKIIKFYNPDLEARNRKGEVSKGSTPAVVTEDTSLGAMDGSNGDDIEDTPF